MCASLEPVSLDCCDSVSNGSVSWVGAHDSFVCFNKVYAPEVLVDLCGSCKCLFSFALVCVPVEK